MNNWNSKPELPDWKLERYLLGELPSEDASAIQAKMQEDSVLRERLDALAQSNLDLLDRYPPAWMSRKTLRKLDEQAGVTSRTNLSRLWRPPAFPALAAAAAVLLLVAVLPRAFVDSGIRLKGLRPHLVLCLKTEDGIKRLVHGNQVREHDLIQIVYQAAGRKHGVILSVDGRGSASLHLPYAGSRSASLRTGQPDTLDFAYELDDAPRWERFYFITADKPFEVETLVQAARIKATSARDSRGDSLDVPEAFDQFILTLRKGTER